MKLTDDIRKAQKALLTSPPRGSKLAEKRRRRAAAAWEGGFESEALGVGVSQISAARAELARKGVDCDFNPRTGAAIMKSDKHYREVGKALGMFTGRDGWDSAGATGKRPVKEREAVKEELRRELGNVGYAELFPGN